MNQLPNNYFSTLDLWLVVFMGGAAKLISLGDYPGIIKFWLFLHLYCHCIQTASIILKRP